MLTFVDRIDKGQSEESNEDQTVGKQLSVMAVDHDPSNACSDDIQINSVSQRRRGFNETLNVNVAFLADPRSSRTHRQYIDIYIYMNIYTAQTFKEGTMLCCTKT